MTGKFKQIAFIFPGQGAQYPGMGKDFYENFNIVKETFEAADDLLNCHLSKVILEGPEEKLTETRYSQLGIYVVSIALLRVLQASLSTLRPKFCAGLSLGEYTALTASKKLSFEECLKLIDRRSQLMQEACEKNHGTMAVVLGLDADTVEEMIKNLKLPNEIWAANFNCPSQVAISGTVKGIEEATKAAKQLGAKRVLPLQVQGAFHSGLMQDAQDRLVEYIKAAPFKESDIHLVMNVNGQVVDQIDQIKEVLSVQITSPVRWEKSIHTMQELGSDLFLEIGCGKVLSGFNKRIGVNALTSSIETLTDLENFVNIVNQ